MPNWGFCGLCGAYGKACGAHLTFHCKHCCKPVTAERMGYKSLNQRKWGYWQSAEREEDSMENLGLSTDDFLRSDQISRRKCV